MKSLEAIKKELNDYYGRLSFAEIQNPDFNNCSKVHDWKNYICDTFQEIWNELPEIAKIALYAMADDIASNEEWD